MTDFNVLSKMIPPEKLRQEREKYIDKIIVRNQHRNLSNTYKNGAKILNYIEIEKIDVETAVNRLQLKDIDNSAKDMVKLAISHQQEIDYLLKTTRILQRYQCLDLHLIRILIAEILWGKQKLKIGSREPAIILYHEADLKEAFIETSIIFNNAEDCYTSKFPTYVRINTLSISLEDSINAFIKEGWNLLSRPETYLDYVRIVSHLRKTDFIRDFHVSELLVFPVGTSFYEHPGYQKGKFLMQDKGSCLGSFLLNPKPGSVVLDMCAAPGKTTNHLANIINNQGIVYASDRHPDRYNQLCSLMKCTEVTCVKPIFDDCTNVKINDVNYILVDVSSTYSGIFHKKDDRELDTQLQYYNHLSSNILRYALQSFPSVKRVVFTTCSKSHVEGEKVVQDALKEVGKSYCLLDTKEMLWHEWMSVGDTTKYSFADKCLRIKPEFDMCQSYFIAVFERNFAIPLSLYVHRIDEFYEIICDKDDSGDEITAIDDEITEIDDEITEIDDEITEITIVNQEHQHQNQQPIQNPIQHLNQQPMQNPVQPLNQDLVQNPDQHLNQLPIHLNQYPNQYLDQLPNQYPNQHRNQRFNQYRYRNSNQRLNQLNQHSIQHLNQYQNQNSNQYQHQYPNQNLIYNRTNFNVPLNSQAFLPHVSNSPMPFQPSYYSS